MAYVAGTASSLADLLSAIQGACTANGWMLSGNVLHAGDCYTSLQASDGAIEVQGGTGVDGSHALIAPAPAIWFGAPLNGEPWTYPLNYFLHVFASEVIAVVRWNVSAYTYLAFGCSPAPGLPGTGGWYSTTYGSNSEDSFVWANFGGEWNEGVIFPEAGYVGTGPFWTRSVRAPVNSYVHHGLDGGGWSGDGEVDSLVGVTAKASALASPKLVCQPNRWNSEIVLIPIEPYVSRGENQISVVLDIASMRFVNLQTLDPETIIDLTPDQWRMYPFYRKSSTDFMPGDDHTGWLGIAVKYDGP